MWASSMQSGNRLGFWRLAAVVTVAATLIYAPTWRYDFTHLDDDNLILDQQPELGRSSSLYSVFGRSYFGATSTSYYRPIVNWSLALDAQWSGAHPFGYHFSNVVLHVAACWLLLALMLRMGLGTSAALWGTLVFAVHPVQVASVAWIPGRNDVLMTGFGLGACLALLRNRERPAWTSKALHLLCLLLALLSKETALCLPLLFLLLLWAGEGSFQPLSQRWLWFGWGGAVAFYVAVRHLVLAAGQQSAAEQFGVALLRWPVLLSDLGKLLLPVRLQVLAAPRDVHVWPGIIALVLIALLLWRLPIKHNRIQAFALGCLLLPMLVGLLGAKRVVLENRLYLSTVGVAVLLGHALQATHAKQIRLNRVRLIAATGVLLILGVATVRYSQSYQDRQRFAQAAITASPHSGLAVNLLRRSSLARPAAPPASRSGGVNPGKPGPDPR